MPPHPAVADPPYPACRERALQGLIQIGQVLVSHIDLRDQLEIIVDQAMATLDAEVAILRLLDRAGEYLEVEVARGAPDETVRQVRFRPGDGLAGRVLLSGEPLRGVNLQQDPRTSQRDLARREGWQSFAAVPICLHKQPVGAWFLIRRRRLPFNQDDLTLLSAFADCASLAVERSELFHIIVREKHASEAVIQASANGIMVVDSRGRIVDMNPALEQLIGWRLREARGQPCRDILHCPVAPQPDQEGVGASCACPLHAGTHSPDRTFVEYDIQAHDGRSIPVEASYGLIRDEEGEIDRTVIVFRDISREKELNRQRAEIIANASHELRTPLALIRGYASTLLRPQVALDEAETRRFLRNVNLAAEHLGRLIDDLLYASRLDTDQLRLWPQRFDLCARVRRLLSWFQPHATDHPLLADLPDGPVWAWADPERVDQVLVNLLTNAVKHLPDVKPVTIRVRLLGEADTAQAVIHVIDEGVGIAPQHLPHIFERFYLAEISKEGVGLGLYICKGLVKAMGGDIWAVSELGQGSTFSFSLPTAEPAKQSDELKENNTKE